VSGSVGSGDPVAASRGLARDRRVVDQCVDGVPLVTIGVEHGFVSPGPTVRLVDRAIETALPQLDARAQRRLHRERLERLFAAWWPAATQGDAQAAQVVLSILELGSRLRETDNGPHDS